MSKIPAPIDGKNVSTDWIDAVFDGMNYVSNGCQMAGYVKDSLVSCSWHDNRIEWKAYDDKEKTLAELKKRLKEFQNDDPYAYCYESVYDEIYVIGDICLIQLFYFYDKADANG